MLGRLSFFIVVLMLSKGAVFAQGIASVSGMLTDSEGKPLENVLIAIEGSSIAPSFSNAKGEYSFVVSPDKEFTLVLHLLGYQTVKQKMTLKPNEKRVFSPKLIFINELETVEITDDSRFKTVTRIDPESKEKMPSASQDFNTVLYSQPGVSNSNELSSAYSVRGGNFDENLVYVNGVEVYRPFLLRSGQQEGLSFVNPDLVSSIIFSSGGFETKYGDKMSSVLAIKYRKPQEFNGTVSASLLGSSLHLEGTAKENQFTWLVGARYKTNQYLLNGLNTKGDYKPFFADLQAYLTYQVNPRWDVNFLGNMSHNKYQEVPRNRQTDFGTINEALRLDVYFDGQEIDKFTTGMGAFTTTYNGVEDDLQLTFIASVFRTQESESFDIQGQYFLSEIETDFTSSTFGDDASTIGVGTYLNHARTSLLANVVTAEHKGRYAFNSNVQMLWGLKYNNENISDRLSEWRYVDSAGYSLPNNTPQEIILQDLVKQKINLSSNRVSGYLQGDFERETKKESKIILSAGLRSNYWSVNGQALIGPRASVGYKPNWKRDFLFKFASGYYYQPPFYRELRNREGMFNADVKAQTAIHFVASSDYEFKMWKRPFKFIAEAYYKKLDNLIPYEVDNVRIRYSAENNAVGYATGLDLKINGEFIKDLESWASISIMQTKEDIKDDFYYNYFNSEGALILNGFSTNDVATDSVRVEPGYISRPTDQRINFGLFFQDEMPGNSNLKMHLNLLFGTGLPFGPPNSKRYQQSFKMPSYRRVDIGFSYQALSAERERKTAGVGRYFNSLWISLEVFNLLGTNNTVSYIWVEDISKRQYAVPNFLTSRQLNLRTILKF